MVSPKPTDSSKGKQGLDRSGAVACQHPSSFQGGGCTDISAKLDICTATDPVTVFDVPQETNKPPQFNRISLERITQSENNIRTLDNQENVDRLTVDPSKAEDRSNGNAPKSKLLKNYCASVIGCSRTTPVIWASARKTPDQSHNPVHSPIKKELCVAVPDPLSHSSSIGNSGMNFVNIKIEPKSPNCHSGGLTHTLDIHASSREINAGGGGGGGTMDASNSAMVGPSSHYTAAGQIPVGIAVARQRMHPDPGLNSATGSSNGTMKDLHSSRHLGSTFVEMIQGQQLGNNIFLSAPSSAPAMIGSWQYPMEPMQMPLPPVGLQLVREPTTGQYMFVPAMDPYPQTVVWPYANVQPSQPAPIQFLGTSDYLSASTTLHQHTQTSTRLVALPNNNDLKQRYSMANNNHTGAGLQSTTTNTSDPSSSLMSIVNKVPSLNSHLMPSSMNNTIIKIEDNCAISAGGTMSHHIPQEHLQNTYTTGPTLNTTHADLMNANLAAGGFLMPHTPMLTPAPSMFDMNEKPFLANISQQQRQFQFNLNSSMKNEAYPMTSDSSNAPITHATDFSSLLYAQAQQHLGQTEYHHQNQHQMSVPVPPHCLTSLSSLDGSSAMGGLSNHHHHPTIMLTPPTVIAARSTGGLLTPPSPMPQKLSSQQTHHQQIQPLPAANILPNSVEDNSTSRLENTNNSLLTVCSMDMLSGSGQSQNNDHCLDHQSPSHTNSDQSAVTKTTSPVVQDATMQTDTPVCSDEENTQDTALSESGGVSGGFVNREEGGSFEEDEHEGDSDLNPSKSVQTMIVEASDPVPCHNNTSELPTSVQVVNRQCPESEEVQAPSQEEAEAVQESSNEIKVRRCPVDLSGLELLSNSIEAFETIKREAVPCSSHFNTKVEDRKESNNMELESPVITSRDEELISIHQSRSIPSPPPPPRQLHHNDQFDGLNLLCALAEQRLVEEEGEELHKGGIKNTPTQSHPSPRVEETPKKEPNAVESDFENSPVEKLSDLERNIKQRLADLTRQCEEKRRELDKMEKINPFYRMGYAQYPVPNKFVMSDDEETRSSRSASVRTPLTPTLLFGTNSNGQGGSLNSSQLDHHTPKVSSDTESSKYDEGDLSSLEKMSKRKGVLPKRWDDCSETETIVAKKPKSLVGYIFSSKNRNENENKGSAVAGKGAPLIKHGQLRPHYNPSPSSGSTSSEQQIKFEPIKVKEEIMDLMDEVEMPVVDLFKASTVKSAEERHSSKHRKKNKAKKRHHREEREGKRRRLEMENRCKLTDIHLDDKEKKTRVLTSMGGLFYAGVLSPIQPPDIYSVILDGERGNRPHIMSREEVQRDAVLEIIPTEPSEVPPGTRLCAYWSQQYRCLYPGTAAQPGTPDLTSKKQYISVEFDDGDSGRIAIGDIRLLSRDYPIVEYDPNPLGLGKRSKGRTVSTTEAEPVTTTTITAVVTPEVPSRLDRAAEKERRRMKKIKKHLLKKQQLMPCCQSSATNNEDGSKKKIKCNEELCKHRRHKKKRKHKRHSQEREAAAEAAAASVSGQGKKGLVVELAKEYTVSNVCESEDTVDNKEYSVQENEDTEETMDSYSAVDDPDFKDPANKKKDQYSPEQNKSKIAAFLPARQLWAWAGESYRRSCVKGRVKKQFYKAIQRGKETIEVGDSAVFLSTGRPDRPYIGRITSMWKTNACNMIVRVQWFYHPEEAQGSPSLKYPGGLFESPHEDENDVQTISHKCEVLSVYDFKRKLGDDPKNLSMIYDNNDTYYLAGNYDPTAISLTMQPDIPTTGGGGTSVPGAT